MDKAPRNVVVLNETEWRLKAKACAYFSPPTSQNPIITFLHCTHCVYFWFRQTGLLSSPFTKEYFIFHCPTGENSWRPLAFTFPLLPSIIETYATTEETIFVCYCRTIKWIFELRNLERNGNRFELFLHWSWARREFSPCLLRAMKLWVISFTLTT